MGWWHPGQWLLMCSADLPARAPLLNSSIIMLDVDVRAAKNDHIPASIAMLQYRNINILGYFSLPVLHGLLSPNLHSILSCQQSYIQMYKSFALPGQILSRLFYSLWLVVEMVIFTVMALITGNITAAQWKYTPSHSYMHDEMGSALVLLMLLVWFYEWNTWDGFSWHSLHEQTAGFTYIMLQILPRWEVKETKKYMYSVCNNWLSLHWNLACLYILSVVYVHLSHAVYFTL